MNIRSLIWFEGSGHSLLLLHTVDFDFLFSERSQLLFTRFHVSMDSLGGYGQVTHEGQDGDAVFSRKTVVSIVGVSDLGEDSFNAFR